jgi:hypothetical protein
LTISQGMVYCQWRRSCHWRFTCSAWYAVWSSIRCGCLQILFILDGSSVRQLSLHLLSRLG